MNLIAYDHRVQNALTMIVTFETQTSQNFFQTATPLLLYALDFYRI